MHEQFEAIHPTTRKIFERILSKSCGLGKRAFKEIFSKR